MRPTDILVMLASIMLLVLVLTNVQPSSARIIGRYGDDVDNGRLSDWLLSSLADYRRDRRAHMDAGFLSRHTALKNYLNSFDASIEASDPHGPGRRK
jgi:hypothetical protein